MLHAPGWGHGVLRRRVRTGCRSEFLDRGRHSLLELQFVLVGHRLEQVVDVRVTGQQKPRERVALGRIGGTTDQRVVGIEKERRPVPEVSATPVEIDIRCEGIGLFGGDSSNARMDRRGPGIGSFRWRSVASSWRRRLGLGRSRLPFAGRSFTPEFPRMIVRAQPVEPPLEPLFDRGRRVGLRGGDRFSPRRFDDIFGGEMTV